MTGELHTFRAVCTDTRNGNKVTYTGQALKFAEFERQCRDAYFGLLAAPSSAKQREWLHVDVEEVEA